MEQTQMRSSVQSLHWLAWIAILFNGFVVLVVNFWIYTARWSYIERNLGPDSEPPTISRAISDPYIGEPFAIWITLAGICSIIGVFAIGLYYWRCMCGVSLLSKSFKGVIAVLFFVLLGLQISSAVGMHWLSIYRFPDANEAHMVGSYTFFVSQAFVVIAFTLFNLILMRNTSVLAQLCDHTYLRRKWVHLRFWMGVFCVFFAITYGALFIMKGTATFGQSEAVYAAYVGAEPLLISSFLFLLVLCHVDILPRRRVKRT